MNRRKKIERLRIKNIKDIDYKNTRLLGQYISRYGLIVSRQYTGLGLKMQKKLAQEIKRARFMGLMPYVK